MDYQIISWVNRFAHRSEHFDNLVMLLGSNYILKTGLFIVLLSGLWFLEDENTTERRTCLLFGMIASWTAVLFARILSLMVPF